ncbi:MAG: hypothetical protein WAM60_16655 [Candidatus Promineifilaceae bacterium]
MIIKTLNDGKATVLICLVLVTVFAFGWSRQRTQAAVSASIMYLIPTNIDDLDQSPKPTDFMAVDPQSVGYSSIQQIGYASNWEAIEQLIAKDALDALIVHHAAQDMVNWEEIRELFQQQGLIVAGIGIPGDELANLLGAPAFYDSDATGHDFDYFIYSMQISGQPDDVAKVLDSNLTGKESPQDISAPLTFGAAYGQGYFSQGQESLIRFLGQIDGELSK